MNSILDNLVWHSLSGPHRKYSVGTDDIRRFAPGFSPIIGFANPENPPLDALAPFCQSGEHFYCGGWSGPATNAWRIEQEAIMVRMVWQGSMPPPDDLPEPTLLGPQHALRTVDLANLTRPGPFGIHTTELGEYFGFFDGDCLIAMGGERFYAGSYREISGVCTHPDFQGRGFARRIMTTLIRRQLQRNETPCLHVLRDNTHAHGLYQRMGFRDYCETVVRIISRC